MVHHIILLSSSQLEKYFLGQGARILSSPTSSGAVLSGTRPQEWHPMPPSGTFVKIKTTFIFFFTIMIIIMIIILSDTPGWGEGFPDPHRYLHWPPSFFIYFQLIPTISQSIAFYEGCSPKKGGQNGNSKPTNEKSIGFGFLEIFGYRNQTLQVARMSFHFVCSGELWQPVWNPPHPQLLLLQKLLKDEHNCRISKGDYLNLHSPQILFSIETLHLSTIFLHLNICRCAPRWRTTSHRRCTAGTRRPSCHRFPTPSPEGHLEVTWRSPEGHLMVTWWSPEGHLIWWSPAAGHRLRWATLCCEIPVGGSMRHPNPAKTWSVAVAVNRKMRPRP